VTSAIFTRGITAVVRKTKSTGFNTCFQRQTMLRSNVYEIA